MVVGSSYMCSETLTTFWLFRDERSSEYEKDRTNFPNFENKFQSSNFHCDHPEPTSCRRAAPPDVAPWSGACTPRVYGATAVQKSQLK